MEKSSCNWPGSIHREYSTPFGNNVRITQIQEAPQFPTLFAQTGKSEGTFQANYDGGRSTPTWA